MSYLRTLKLDKRNDLILIMVHLLTVILLCLTLLIRRSAHEVSPDLVMTGFMMGLVPIFFEVIVWVYDSQTQSTKEFALITFSIFLIFVMFNSDSILTFVFSFPMLLVVSIYKDYKYTLESCTTYLAICFVTSITEYITNTHNYMTFGGLVTSMALSILIVLTNMLTTYIYSINSDEQLIELEKAKDRLIYAYTHDVATKLYNRSFLMENYKYLFNTSDNIAISLININGLKLINDLYGNRIGDEVIKVVGHVIKTECNDKYDAFRLDGDEFLIIMPSLGDDEAKIFLDGIANKINEMRIKDIQLSIEYGLVVKHENESRMSMDTCITLAKNIVYQKKMLTSNSFRSSIIDSLKKSLSQSDFETEEHAERTKDMAIKLGKKLGLNDDEQSKVGLLAVLHDIGKMSIPREILTKPGKLTDEEWEIMKTHTIRGYEIAYIVNELRPIADGIKHHHERWNGGGYPSGLKGEEIPLLARIIALVDSHDVMTHNRPYHRAMSHEAAIVEIKRCAGKEFDPYISEVFIELLHELGLDAD